MKEKQDECLCFQNGNEAEQNIKVILEASKHVSGSSQRVAANKLSDDQGAFLNPNVKPQGLFLIDCVLKTI